MSTSAHVVSSTLAVAPSDINAMTPYQVITLLLDGALERIDQAISHITAGDMDDAAILVQKAVGIVGGLRESLNLNQGGDIADNLDALYEYITVRLETMTTDSPLETLAEVKNLLQEVHDGWSGMSASLSD